MEPVGRRDYLSHVPGPTFDMESADIHHITGKEENIGNINYWCPKCGGGFVTWDTVKEKGDRVDVCPFCGVERHNFDPEE